MEGKRIGKEDKEGGGKEDKEGGGKEIISQFHSGYDCHCHLEGCGIRSIRESIVNFFSILQLFHLQRVQPSPGAAP